MKIVLRLLIFSFFTMLSFITFAQRANIKFERITINEGLPNNTVNATYQDHLGYMWLGTANGLVQFDGINYNSYYSTYDSAGVYGVGSIRYIKEDKSGTLWFCGSYGLSRFDRKADKFFRYLPEVDSQKTVINYNDIVSFQEDSKGNFWMSNFESILYYFDKANGKFQRMDSVNGEKLFPVYSFIFDLKPFLIAKDQTVWISSHNGLIAYNPDNKEFTSYFHVKGKDKDSVKTSGINKTGVAYEDPRGNIWAGSSGGLLKVEPKTGQTFVYKFDASKPDGLKNDTCRVYINKKNEIWVITPGFLSKFDEKTQTFEHFKVNSPKNFLIVYEENNHDLWLSLVNNKKFSFYPAYFDYSTGVVTEYKPGTNLAGAFGNNFGSFCKDLSGSYWFGSVGDGISHYVTSNNRFSLSNTKIEKLGKIDKVYAFWQTGDTIWIGTDTSLISYNTTTSKRIKWDDKKGFFHSGTNILLKDKSNNLWVGTKNGLLLINLNTGNIIIPKAIDDKEEILKKTSIVSIFQDSKKTFWVGAYGKGLIKFNFDENKNSIINFKQYQYNQYDKNSLGDNRVFSVIEDHKKRIWISSLGNCAINLYNPEKDYFERFYNRESQFLGVHNIMESDGKLWISTESGGLQVFDLETKKVIKVYDRFNKNFPESTIKGIVQDKNHIFWIVTEMGFCRFDPKTEKHRLFNEKEGLAKKYKNFFYPYINQAGEIFYGGDGGMNIFNPDSMFVDAVMPMLRITALKLSNNKVLPSDANSPLTEIIEDTKEITLPYYQNVFTIEFAALHFVNPEKIEYSCLLEGIDKDWQHIGNQMFINYTGLQSGTYIFRLKAINSDGVPCKEELTFKITIRPPWWRSKLAYALYIFGACALIAWGYRSMKLKVKRSQEYANKMTEANERLALVDKMKDEFLANTSHELRTPLNGIIGLTESVIDGVGGELNDVVKSNLQMVVSSGKRLSSLVNDLLDFSKLKNHELNLQLRPTDLGTLSEVILALSKPLAKGKDIILTNTIPSGTIVMADENRLQQILLNLIGNAIKFTENGQVNISLADSSDDNLKTICVSDTGIGIDSKKIEKIFLPFEQGEGSIERIYGGTGIGLSVTKQLIELHNGSIWAESQLNVGSKFYFTLPKAEGIVETIAVAKPAKEEILFAEQVGKIVANNPKLESIAYGGSISVLVVDDEPINLQVLDNHLSLQNFKVTQAQNGAHAIELISKHDFDLVVLDVMMPRMSGYEVCNKIREMHTAAELPVILLTAKNLVTDIITGFDSGANDYLTKPFQKEELLARIKTHVNLLKANRELADYSRTLEQKVEERTQEVVKQKDEILEKNEALKSSFEIVNSQKEELVSMSNELRATNTKLIEMDEFKQGMTSMIVHDLKNPLNLIISVNEAEAVKQIKRIKQSGRQMLNMVMNILDVHKYEDTKVTLSCEKLAMYKLVNEAISEVLFLSEEKNISIHNNISEKYASLADRDIIKRVFINILTNGIKYTPNNGKIEVDAELSGSGFLRIKISDNGQGIAEDKIHLVFQKFGQIVARNSGAVRSTGLGLTFCKMVVEAHGGTINVESEHGKGSVFWFTLPRETDIVSEKANNESIKEPQKQLPLLTGANAERMKAKLDLLKTTEIYKITELGAILKTIDESENEEIKLWKQALMKAINSGNELLFSELIKRTNE